MASLDTVNSIGRAFCKKSLKFWHRGSVPFRNHDPIDFEVYIMPLNSWIIRLLNANDKRAITLGEVVIVRAGELSPELIRHEAVHVEQWRRGGLKFGWRYIFNPSKFEKPAEVAQQGGGGDAERTRDEI